MVKSHHYQLLNTLVNAAYARRKDKEREIRQQIATDWGLGDLDTLDSQTWHNAEYETIALIVGYSAAMRDPTSTSAERYVGTSVGPLLGQWRTIMKEIQELLNRGGRPRRRIRVPEDEE